MSSGSHYTVTTLSNYVIITIGILVPNKQFITGQVVNWSLSDQITRVLVVVGVAYGSDVDKALDLM